MYCQTERRLLLDIRLTSGHDDCRESESARSKPTHLRLPRLAALVIIPSLAPYAHFKKSCLASNTMRFQYH